MDRERGSAKKTEYGRLLCYLHNVTTVLLVLSPELRIEIVRNYKDMVRRLLLIFKPMTSSFDQ